ncbi:MAG: AtpZ/AtpI family protein [Actinobacteria bacterium]|nr:AtpZ/AtpI family protein [Actinomycetota bacterium]
MKLVPRTKPIDADDNIGRGMDFALVILVFLGIGWALDRAFDTRPAFMIGCTVFSVAGQFIRMWYAYDARMSQLESERTTELRSAPRASVVVEDLAYAPLVIPTDIGRDEQIDEQIDERIEHADGTQGATA